MYWHTYTNTIINDRDYFFMLNRFFTETGHTATTCKIVFKCIENTHIEMLDLRISS